MKTIFCLNSSTRNKKIFFFLPWYKRLKYFSHSPTFHELEWLPECLQRRGSEGRFAREELERGNTVFYGLSDHQKRAKLLLEIQFLWLSARIRIPKSCLCAHLPGAEKLNLQRASSTKLTWRASKGLGQTAKINILFSFPPTHKGEIYGILLDFCSRVQLSHDFPQVFFLQSMDLSPHPDGLSAPRLLDPTWQPKGGHSPQPPASLSGCRSWQSIVSLQCCCREKEESDFDRFIFRFTFFFFLIYLRSSVYLLGRTLSSPKEATTEPWKTIKS